MKKILIIIICAALAAGMICVLVYGYMRYEREGNLLAVHTSDIDPLCDKLKNLSIPFTVGEADEAGAYHIRVRAEFIPIIENIAGGFDGMKVDAVYRDAHKLFFAVICPALFIVTVGCSVIGVKSKHTVHRVICTLVCFAVIFAFLTVLLNCPMKI